MPATASSGASAIWAATVPHKPAPIVSSATIRIRCAFMSVVLGSWGQTLHSLHSSRPWGLTPGLVHVSPSGVRSQDGDWTQQAGLLRFGRTAGAARRNGAQHAPVGGHRPVANDTVA